MVIENYFQPTVKVIWPNGGEILQGTVEIRWTASDRNDPLDSLTYTVAYLLNEEESVIIAENVHATHLIWDTHGVPNLNWTMIRVEAKDPGNLTAIDDSNAGVMIRNNPFVTTKPPQWLVRMAQGMILGRGVLFLFIVSMVLIDQMKKHEQQALQTTPKLQKKNNRLKRKKDDL